MTDDKKTKTSTDTLPSDTELTEKKRKSLRNLLLGAGVITTATKATE